MRVSVGFVIAALLASAAAQVGTDGSFGPGGAFRLESSRDGFGERSHGVIETTGGHQKLYALPQSTFEDYQTLRPHDLVVNPFPAKDYQRQEAIGPHQVEGGRLWFGKTFYDGEGERGVGAFGYFDTATRDYTLFSPPETAAWETSAILVEKDVVWMGLDRFGEDISTSPGGLARWERNSQKIRVYPLEFTVTAIERRGNLLRLSTKLGYAEFRNNGAVHRFEIRQDASGASVAVPVDRFPPPPTRY